MKIRSLLSLLCIIGTSSLVACTAEEAQEPTANETETPAAAENVVDEGVSPQAIAQCERLPSGGTFCCHIVNGMWWCQP